MIFIYTVMSVEVWSRKAEFFKSDSNNITLVLLKKFSVFVALYRFFPFI